MRKWLGALTHRWGVHLGRTCRAEVRKLPCAPWERSQTLPVPDCRGQLGVVARRSADLAADPQARGPSRKIVRKGRQEAGHRDSSGPPRAGPTTRQRVGHAPDEERCPTRGAATGRRSQGAHFAHFTRLAHGPGRETLRNAGQRSPSQTHRPPHPGCAAKGADQANPWRTASTRGNRVAAIRGPRSAVRGATGRGDPAAGRSGQPARGSSIAGQGAPASVATMSALMVCIRFSASSKTTE